MHELEILNAWFVIAVLAAVQSVALLAQAWENRRFARRRLRRTSHGNSRPFAAVFAPCKGLDTELVENLRPLLEQDYGGAYQVTFIVESASDPACEPIRRLIALHPRVRANLLVAGIASDLGQKVHNLRQATADLPSRVEVLAFVDSDARPGSHWLSSLVERLDRPAVGAVTGYRWFMPTRPTLVNGLLFGLNAGLASVMGPGGHHLVWGGSWAIRRETFEQCRMHDAWGHVLSDDLVATMVLRRAGLRIEFEPNCMVESPVDYSIAGMFRFIRRQYLIGRMYAPGWWMLGLAGAFCPVVAFWSGLVLCGVGAWQAAPHTATVAALTGLLYLLGVLRAAERERLARTYFPAHTTRLTAAARVDLWAGPLIGLMGAVGIVSSMVGKSIAWRGIRYRLDRGGRVRLVQRDDPPSVPQMAPREPASERFSRPQAVRPSGQVVASSIGGW